MSNEPYEVMPEGEPHAVADWFTGLIAALMLALIIVIAASCDANAGENWCEEWKQGYEASFYLVCRQCQTIEPKQCPEPKQDETDGYMRGVVDGAADGKQARKEWI